MRQHGTLISTGIAAALVALMIAVGSSLAGTVQVPLSGWSWGNPSPQGNGLEALDFTGLRGYAVGAAGTALRSDDGGATWSGLATGTAADLTRLQIVDPQTVVVLGGDGCVLRRTEDGGRTFKKIFIVAESDCPDRVQAFWFVDPKLGYLLLRDGSVLRTADGGQSFSKQTAIPGTNASAAGGRAAATDILFTAPDTGIAFVSGDGVSSAYATTDAGVSWKQLTIPSADVRRLYRLDPTTIFAVGKGVLLRSTDAGASFHRRALDAVPAPAPAPAPSGASGASGSSGASGAAGPAAAPQPSGPPIPASATLTSIHCADASTCLLTTGDGALARTTDAGATATLITASSVPLRDAAFATATRAVAVGVAGQTVISGDAGINYAPVGGDIGGSFNALRRGPTVGSAYAPGAKGQIAITGDGGANWRVAAVSTSADIRDTSWSDEKTGYALDVRGGLFQTRNAGQSWSTLSAGAGGAPRALIAFQDNGTVLLAGPRGVRLSVAGGQFNGVSRKPIAGQPLTDASLAGTAVVAWQGGGSSLFESKDKGRSWSSLTLPNTKRSKKTHKLFSTTRLRSVSFVSPKAGVLLETNGRLWRTANAGRSWTELLGAGTEEATHVSFGSVKSGYLSLGSFGDDTSEAYVLHTSDAGATWRPQGIAKGEVSSDGLVAADATHAFSLLRPSGSSGATKRELFFTNSGGDAGNGSALKISASPKVLSKRTLKKRRSAQVTISGRLGGASGGEQITVSARPLGSSGWDHSTVPAGANGGSFSADFTVRGPTVFVAQWAGDSGRRGAGSAVLRVVAK